MNVSVFSIGRFHHFNLGRELLRRGNELRLYTSNPHSKVDRDLWLFVKTRSRYRIPFAIGGRLGLSSKLYWLDEMLLKDLSRWLRSSIDAGWTDIFHCMDGTGPGAGRSVKERGNLWICDRGSTHIAAQRDILSQEYREWQLPPPQFSSNRVERSVEEYEESHAITVPSHFAKASFLQHGIPEERVFVCPYGVDLSEFRPGQKKDGVFRVLYVGQISVRKGIGYLLQALEPLVQQGRLELWMAGEIEAAIQPLLNKFRGVFQYKGIWPRAELWRLYAQASVFVLASVEEGLSLVQGQAMACGLPVIATTNTGAEDLFTDGVEGWIVPIRNPGAIRDRVEWMMDHPNARAEMAAAALVRVKSLGGWESYGARVELVYRELMVRQGLQRNGAETSQFRVRESISGTMS